MGLEMPENLVDPYSGYTNSCYTASESSSISSGSGSYAIRVPSRSPVIGALPIRGGRRGALVQPSAPVASQFEWEGVPQRPRRYSYPMCSVREPSGRSEEIFETMVRGLVQIANQSTIQKEESRKTQIILTSIVIAAMLFVYCLTIYILVNWD